VEITAMADIVERLRDHPGIGDSVTVQFRRMVTQRRAAADEIERLHAALRETDQILEKTRRERDRLHVALEPFAAQADIKGGTAAAEKFKALIVYMMEVNKPGDGVDIIYQFTTACLNARAALNIQHREGET
jgi:hypothetical protein